MSGDTGDLDSPVGPFRVGADARIAAQRLGVVLDLGRHVSALHDPEELLPEACRLIAEAFGYDTVGISLIDPTTNDRLYPAAAYPPNRRLPQSFRVPIGRGLTGWVAQRGVPRLANDVTAEPLYIEGPGRSTRSELDVPLRAGDHILGVLNAESDRFGAFQEDDVPFLEVVAILLAQAITAARLAAQSREAAAMQERTRVARELHDETMQALAAIARQLDLLQMDLESGVEPGGRIGLLRDLTNRTLDGVRRLSRDLRPEVLQDLGLVAALRALADEQAALGFQVDVEVVGEPHRLEGAVEYALYRVAHEAVSNAAQHSDAGSATVALTFDPEEVRLEIADSGPGFDVTEALRDPSHLGLRGMRDRVAEIRGELELDAAPGKSTRVRVVAPSRLTIVDRL